MMPPTNNAPSKTITGVVILAISFSVFGMLLALTILQQKPPTNGVAQVLNNNSGIAQLGWQVDSVPLTLLDGQTVDLRDYRGKIVFMNFWATWCVPCQREMPTFEAFMRNQPTDAVVLAVNNGEDTPTVQQFINQLELRSLPIVLDTDFRLADQFGVRNLPVTYVIDPDGYVTTFKLGEMTADDLQAYLQQIKQQTS
ncbi:MAG: TlpA family protein disulfide reductase [Phototrophicaceae bacterium]